MTRAAVGKLRLQARARCQRRIAELRSELLLEQARLASRLLHEPSDIEGVGAFDVPGPPDDVPAHQRPFHAATLRRADAMNRGLTLWADCFGEIEEADVEEAYLAAKNRLKLGARYTELLRSEDVPVEDLMFRDVNRKRKPWRGFGLYVANGAPGFVKIGISTNIRRRMKWLRGSSPYPFRVLASSQYFYSWEVVVHRWFSQERARGEWFRVSPPLAEFIVFLQALEMVERPRERLWLTY